MKHLLHFYVLNILLAGLILSVVSSKERDFIFQNTGNDYRHLSQVSRQNQDTRTYFADSTDPNTETLSNVGLIPRYNMSPEELEKIPTEIDLDPRNYYSFDIKNDGTEFTLLDREEVRKSIRQQKDSNELVDKPHNNDFHDNSPFSNKYNKIENDIYLDSPIKKLSNSDSPSPKFFLTKIDSYHRYSKILTMKESDTIIFFTFTENELVKNKSKLFTSSDFGQSYRERTFHIGTKDYNVDDVFIQNNYIIAVDRHSNYIFVSADYGKYYWNQRVPVRPDVVEMHPYLPHLIMVQYKDRLVMTNDDGYTFLTISTNVHKFFWVKDRTGDFFIITKPVDTQLGGKLLLTNAYTPAKSDIMFTDVIDVDQFDATHLFVHTYWNFTNTLAIIDETKNIKICQFPHKLKATNFNVVYADADEIFVLVTKPDGQSDLFTSLKSELRFVRVGLNVQHVASDKLTKSQCTDLYFNKRLDGIVLGNFRKNINGSQYYPSFASFDHGTRWNLVHPASERDQISYHDCKLPNCVFSLHFDCQDVEGIDHELVVDKNAPHLVISQAYIKDTKTKKSKDGLFISRDSGVHWELLFGGFYTATMLNDGGIIAAVPLRGNEIYYSYDEGLSFDKISVTDNIDFFKILSEKTKTGVVSVKAMVVGLDSGQWVSTVIDFDNVLTTNCTTEDYVDYIPTINDFDHCFQGKKQYIPRKKHTSICRSIYSTLPLADPIVCYCDSLDFGCNFGYMMVDGFCQFDPDYDKSTDGPPDKSKCTPGEWIEEESGIAKIDGDACIQDSSSEAKGVHTAICGYTEEFNTVTIKFGSKFQFSNNYLTPDVPISFYDLPFSLPTETSLNQFTVDLLDHCLYYITRGVGIQRICWKVREQALHMGPELIKFDKTVKAIDIDFIGKNLYYLDANGINLMDLRRKLTKTIVPGQFLQFKIYPTADRMIYVSSDYRNITLTNLMGKVIIQTIANFDVVSVSYNTLDDIMYAASNETIYSYTNSIFTVHDLVKSPPLIDLNVRSSTGRVSYISNGVLVLDSTSISTNLAQSFAFFYSYNISDNPCINLGCPFLCIPNEEKKAYCDCPDNMEHSPGDKWCFCDNDHPDCLQCSKGQFTCLDSTCIPESSRCDGFNDCPDNSDEKDCDFVCNTEQFQCVSSKQCIKLEERCDGIPTCSDGSDEIDCEPKTNCSPEQFECENYHCINKDAVCNNINDCGDFSDERGCEGSTCDIYEFTCVETLDCIPLQLVCDGNFDCEDWSDEKNCNNIPDDSDDVNCAVKCMDGTCLSNDKLCNHITDCPEGSDEVFCGYQPYCSPGYTACSVTNECYSYKEYCDGFPDCSDNSDEMNCLERDECNDPYIFSCKLGNKCISINKVCDEQVDCPDASDEVPGCGNLASIDGLHAYFNRNDEIVLKWRTKNSAEDVTFKIKISQWHSNFEPLEFITDQKNFVLPSLELCHSYIFAVQFETTVIGMKTTRFKDFIPIPPAPTNLHLVGSRIEWDENKFKCIPTTYFVECQRSKDLVHRTFTQSFFIQYDFEPLKCQISSCPTQAFNLSCSEFAYYHNKTKSGIGSTKIALIIFFVIIVPALAVSLYFIVTRWSDISLKFKKLMPSQLKDFRADTTALLDGDSDIEDDSSIDLNDEDSLDI